MRSAMIKQLDHLAIFVADLETFGVRSILMDFCSNSAEIPSTVDDYDMLL